MNVTVPFSGEKFSITSSTPLTDEKLYELCKKYGLQARLWRQKFSGLLPEVSKRKLYEKKGFGSIFEFAKKLAGLSEEQVRLVLNLEKRFEDKPILLGLLEDGKVSMNKLARVVSVATRENETFWANQVKILSKSALETLLRDHRSNEEHKPQNAQKSLPGQTPEQQLKLSSAVYEKLLELQNKGIGINELILEFLEKRELEIAREKEKMAAEIEAKVRDDEATRYIPVKIKKLVQQEYGRKCAIQSCRREAKIIHHTKRFSLERNHNPYYLAPLCREHHEIAHSIDLKFQRARRKEESER